jgi:dolichyl-phosphate-mannose-protein mannosyltransferase
MVYPSRFQLSLLSIFLFSLVLRFWNLSQFNTLVFDEIYYAKYANEFLNGKEFFQSHPPLSQYLIAIGIWIGSLFPASADTINILTGTALSTFSYRWLNAFTGSFIPVVVGAIAYQLTLKKSIGIIAALLASLDGLFLVESRYALNNVYLIIFGLLGQLFFLLALRTTEKISWLLLAGMFFSFSALIKWNGLGFLLGILLLIASARIGKFLLRQEFSEELWREIIQLKIRHIILALLVFPLFLYSILWIPYLLQNPQYNLLQVHQEIWSFHQRIEGNTPDVHPYCSPWYSWLIMWRPVAYYYVREGDTIYDVHAMGNPILWILSTVAIAFLFLRSLLPAFGRSNEYFNSSIAAFLLCNYIANLLPWLKITRCTFLYHYMASYTFAWIALAWMIDESWHAHSRVDRVSARVALVIIALAFFYWLPLYLGLPLSVPDYYHRMLIPSWI